jgi:hypothetical protein
VTASVGKVCDYCGKAFRQRWMPPLLRLVKADPHIPFRSHAVPMPFVKAKTPNFEEIILITFYLISFPHFDYLTET